MSFYTATTAGEEMPWVSTESGTGADSEQILNAAQLRARLDGQNHIVRYIDGPDSWLVATAEASTGLILWPRVAEHGMPRPVRTTDKEAGQ